VIPTNGSTSVPVGQTQFRYLQPGASDSAEVEGLGSTPARYMPVGGYIKPYGYQDNKNNARREILPITWGALPAQIVRLVVPALRFLMHGLWASIDETCFPVSMAWAPTSGPLGQLKLNKIYLCD
jgi:hypothetical protein